MKNLTENNVSVFLKQDEYQQEMADRISETVFKTQQDAQNTAEVINNFIDSYLENPNQPIDIWLLDRFSHYPEIWDNEQEKIETADIIISTIDTLIHHQNEIDKSLNKGKTLTQIFNHKIYSFSEAHKLDSFELQQNINTSLKIVNEAYTELLLGEKIELNSQNPISPKTVIELARNNQERLLTNANLNLALYATKRSGQRLWNSLTGKANLDRAEELRNILRMAIESVENRGVQIALSGGIVVSVKKGWVKDLFNTLEQVENVIERSRTFFETLPSLVLNVANGWNDLRILDRVEQGAIQSIDVAKETAKFSVAKTITGLEKTAEIILKQGGKKIGTTLGTMIGSLFSPAGAVIGGTVGGFVGEKVGNFMSEEIVKPIAQTARKVAGKAIDYVADKAKSVVSSASTMVSRGVEKISSFFSNIFS